MENLSFVFLCLEQIDNFVWGYLCVPMILLIGLQLSWTHRFPQISKIKFIAKTIVNVLSHQDDDVHRGVKPLRAFFTSFGSSVGVGNIVAVCTSIQIGGPGALFWLWVAAFLGMVVKYTEVFLGIKYRISNKEGSYDGGPMFYLKKVYGPVIVPTIVSILLGLYGVEVYMFKVCTDTLSINWGIPPIFLVIFLLLAITRAAHGGINFVGRIASSVIPLFLGCFISMCLWILFDYRSELSGLFRLILSSAFSGHAAVGAFAGSTMLSSMAKGMGRACYSGDIGVGFAPVVHVETVLKRPQEQAVFEILGIFIDAFVISTLTTLVILATGVWTEEIPAAILLQTAFSKYFPGMHIFFPFFIFLLGCSTLMSFFVVGKKCIAYLKNPWATKLYYLYAFCAYLTFSIVPAKHALVLMSVVGATLLLINVTGLFLMRKEVHFSNAYD